MRRDRIHVPATVLRVPAPAVIRSLREQGASASAISARRSPVPSLWDGDHRTPGSSLPAKSPFSHYSHVPYSRDEEERDEYHEHCHKNDENHE